MFKKASYCYREAWRIFDGAAVSFAVGTNTDPLNADTLGDGSGDYSVYQSQVDPTTHDADDDGLTDAEERTRGTNLMDADTDGDGMPDGWEQLHTGNGFDPNVDNSADANPNNDRDADPDGDGLTNGREAEVGTNPGVSDTDGDGIAAGAADLSVSVTIRAMNVRDGRLPSSVIVGMFPLNVVQENMPTSTGVAGTTDAGTAYVRENIPSNGVAYITGQPAAPQLEKVEK